MAATLLKAGHAPKRQERAGAAGCSIGKRKEFVMPLLLWLLGVPGIIVILLWITGIV